MAGGQRTLQGEREQVAYQIAVLCGAWAQNVHLKL
jgi:hypothetical protein